MYSVLHGVGAVHRVQRKNLTYTVESHKREHSNFPAISLDRAIYFHNFTLIKLRRQRSPDHARQVYRPKRDASRPEKRRKRASGDTVAEHGARARKLFVSALSGLWGKNRGKVRVCCISPGLLFTYVFARKVA